MFCSPTAISVGLDIAFMYSVTIPEINSRTNILSKAVLTGYQVDNANTITMSLFDVEATSHINFRLNPSIHP